MKKWMKSLGAAAVLTLSFSIPAFAGQWHEDMAGRWYENDDGDRIYNGWHWVDDDGDGIGECYYFDTKGYAVTANGVADGYDVNEDGAWIKDGVVQTKDVSVPNDSAAVAAYQAAMEKMNALDSLEADLEMCYKLGIPEEGDMIDMDITGTLQMRGMQTEDPEFLLSGTLSTNGEEAEPFTIFYTNGYQYMDTMGSKVKEPMEATEAGDSATALQEQMGGVSLAGMRNLQMETAEDGSAVLTYQFNTSDLNGIFAQLMGGSAETYESLGLAVDYHVTGNDGEMTITPEGYCGESRAYMETEMTIGYEDEAESETMTMTTELSVDIVYNNPGEAVDFTLPSTDGYEEAIGSADGMTDITLE